MNRRIAARVAAPAAFLAGFTIAVLVVRAGLSDESSTSIAVSNAPAPTTGTTATTRRTTTRRAQPVYATVERGDTLDQIALEHDTTVARLLELNPGLDPNAMQVGQRVRVR